MHASREGADGVDDSAALYLVKSANFASVHHEPESYLLDEPTSSSGAMECMEVASCT